MNTLEFADEVIAPIADPSAAHVGTDDGACDGRFVQVGGRSVRNFASCSYLGLQHHPALIEGAIDAIRRYGTQFVRAKGRASPALHHEAEGLLSEVFGVPTMVTPSTTLGHIAALRELITRDDAALFDRHVHQSAQTAVVLSAVHGARVEAVAHNDLDALARRARELARRHRRVWHLCDGAYSMFGDFAPMGALTGLLDEIPELHLYVDDAHGTGWFGERGRGYALERTGVHPRVVAATSLSKSFACSGGALMIPDPEMRRQVRDRSGPMPPAALGALVASARVHLSDELPNLQGNLGVRLAYATRRAGELGLPMVNAPRSPVRFLATGDEAVMRAMVRGLLDAGFWTNGQGFPAAPHGRAGVRFTITNAMSFEDIEMLLRAMAALLPVCLYEAGRTLHETEAASERIRARLNLGLAA